MTERVVVHQEEVGDTLMGVVAGYLHWCGLIDQGAQAVAIVERLFGRQMGQRDASSWRWSRRSQSPGR